jgi:glycosyltransferase involved in cell wall biosynthesis
MKLLIITQKIDKNDDVLGFMHGWVAEFARQCERVTVIALGVGEYNLPENVRVLSLGKECRPSRLRYLLNFYRYIWSERKNYDAVLVHMNHEYIVLGGILWRMLDKRIALWYAHGYVPPTLRLAEMLSHVVFASTRSGFRLPSKKFRVIGQGIDTDVFPFFEREKEERLKVLIVGRISPVKDYETLLRAIARLAREGKNVELSIIGGAGLPKQETYLEKLKKLAFELDIEKRVHFVGSVPNAKIIEFLKDADCFASTSNTGSLDKAMAEAMATGLPTVSSNIAMREVLGDLSERLMFGPGDDNGLAERLFVIMAMSAEERNELGKRLREIIVRDHDLKTFVRKIISGIRETT